MTRPRRKGQLGESPERRGDEDVGDQGPHRLIQRDEHTCQDRDAPDDLVGDHPHDRRVAHQKQQELAVRIGANTSCGGAGHLRLRAQHAQATHARSKCLRSTLIPSKALA